MKITREQIQETIEQLNKELKEHQTELEALLVLNKNDVESIIFQETHFKVSLVDWMDVVKDEIAERKIHIDLLTKLLVSYYC